MDPDRRASPNGMDRQASPNGMERFVSSVSATDGIRAIVVKVVGRNLPQNTLNGQRPSLNTQNVLGRAGFRNSVSSVCREMRPGPVDQCPAGKKQHKGNRLADRERSHRGTRIAAQDLDAEADAGISHQIAPKNQTRRPLPETPIEEEERAEQQQDRRRLEELRRENRKGAQSIRRRSRVRSSSRRRSSRSVRTHARAARRPRRGR